MPLYEYECRKCRHRFEEIQKVSARPIAKCPKCRTGRVVKLLSAPAVRFKGSGWYVTDYAGKGKSDPKSDPAEKPPDKSDKAEKTDKPAREPKADKSRKA